MRARRTIAALVLIVAAIGLTYTLTRALWFNPEPGVAPAAAHAAGARPVRIVIPALSIDTTIEYPGMTTGNRMAHPSSFYTVAWYDLGVSPGEVGTAVLYGHRDNGLGLTGVFRHLGDLKLGDTVTITGEDGIERTFTVDGVEVYPYQEVPPKALGAPWGDGKARISLITCTGGWVFDREVGMTYDKRLIVYATRPYE